MFFIDPEVCTGCGECKDACPCDAISEDETVAVLLIPIYVQIAGLVLMYVSSDQSLKLPKRKLTV